MYSFNGGLFPSGPQPSWTRDYLIVVIKGMEAYSKDGETTDVHKSEESGVHRKLHWHGRHCSLIPFSSRKGSWEMLEYIRNMLSEDSFP